MLAKVIHQTVEREVSGQHKLVTDCKLIESGEAIAIWDQFNSKRFNAGELIEVKATPGRTRTLYKFLCYAPVPEPERRADPPASALTVPAQAIVWPRTIANPKIQNNLGLYWEALLGSLEMIDQVSPGDSRRIEHARNMAATVFIQSVQSEP